jgi:hypothetical protein
VTQEENEPLMKYIRAKKECEMKLEHTADVCFWDDWTVGIRDSALHECNMGESK